MENELETLEANLLFTFESQRACVLILKTNYSSLRTKASLYNHKIHVAFSILVGEVLSHMIIQSIHFRLLAGQMLHLRSF